MSNTPTTNDPKMIKDGKLKEDGDDDEHQQSTKSDSGDDGGDSASDDDNKPSSKNEPKGGASTASSSGGGGGGNYDRLEYLRRQKRLAMNRQSAKNRRRKKKELLGTLETRCNALTQTNQTLRNRVEELGAQNSLLQAELMQARATIAALSGGQTGNFLAGQLAMPNASAGLNRQAGGGLATANQFVSGGPATAGLSGLLSSEQAQLRYAQMLQNSNTGGGSSSNNNKGGNPMQDEPIGIQQFEGLASGLNQPSGNRPNMVRPIVVAC